MASDDIEYKSIPNANAQGDAGEVAGLHDFPDTAATSQIRALRGQVDGVHTQAAERLGVDRTTLYRLMRKYGIDGT